MKMTLPRQKKEGEGEGTVKSKKRERMAETETKTEREREKVMIQKQTTASHPITQHPNLFPLKESGALALQRTLCFIYHVISRIVM